MSAISVNNFNTSAKRMEGWCIGRFEAALHTGCDGGIDERRCDARWFRGRLHFEDKTAVLEHFAPKLVVTSGKRTFAPNFEMRPYRNHAAGYTIHWKRKPSRTKKMQTLLSGIDKRTHKDSALHCAWQLSQQQATSISQPTNFPS